MDKSRSEADQLYREYGPLLNTERLVEILGYPTASALQKAVQRGKLPFPVKRLPGRRGWYASTRQVGAWLDQTFPASSRGDAP